MKKLYRGARGMLCGAFFGAALTAVALLSGCGVSFARSEQYSDMKIGNTAAALGVYADSMQGGGGALPADIQGRVYLTGQTGGAGGIQGAADSADGGIQVAADGADGSIQGAADGADGGVEYGVENAATDAQNVISPAIPAADNLSEISDYPTDNNTDYSAQLSAMDTAMVGWGVKLKGRSPPEVPKAQREELKKYNAVYAGNPETKELYLTFDLGYENGYTETVLDTLSKRGVKATFFITGYYLSDQPEIIKRIIADGHVIANHSLNHKSFPGCTDEALKDEILGLAAKYEEATGLELTKLVRPPSGEYSERSLALSASLGYKTIFWSFAYVDYDETQKFTIDYAYKKITDNLHNGAIILLHTVVKEGAYALDRVLVTALDEGYTFSTIDKLSE